MAQKDFILSMTSLLDMGMGQRDDSFFIKEDIQPESMNTTDLIYKMVDNISFVFHIGDMSYARGFSAVVSPSAQLYKVLC